mmetsp:Transcript_45225/g.88806  ORF Transcript_45225/g.88806 Transcript_45225/m.88806 type:complete len:150 (-) Transcript_45225:2830-3279(-)
MGANTSSWKMRPPGPIATPSTDSLLVASFTTLQCLCSLDRQAFSSTGKLLSAEVAVAATVGKCKLSSLARTKGSSITFTFSGVKSACSEEGDKPFKYSSTSSPNGRPQLPEAQFFEPASRSRNVSKTGRWAKRELAQKATSLRNTAAST